MKKLTGFTLLIALIFLMFSMGCKKSSNSNDNNNINPPGTITDIDGNVYHTVTIGTQIWMVENLKTTRYRNGDSILYQSDSNHWGGGKVYCWYNDDPAKKSVYGALYGWDVISDSRNIAPIGWHVPSDNEWGTLTAYLGGDSVAGGKMKEVGTIHWASPNTGATNLSGFTALPGGVISVIGIPGGPFAVFGGIRHSACFWSSTQSNYGSGGLHAWYRRVFYGTKKVERLEDFMTNGFSIRCVKD